MDQLRGEMIEVLTCFVSPNADAGQPRLLHFSIPDASRMSIQDVGELRCLAALPLV
jgi:hypothetical protein